MQAACIQMDISHCARLPNIDKALSMAGKAATAGAKLIVFPEVFSTGFCYDHIKDVAERAPCPTIGKLCEFSKEHDCVLIGSIIELKEDDNTSLPYFNLGFCIESGNLAGTYRKIHVFGQEKSFFSGGDRISPIKLERNGMTIGLEICYDLRFPEVARKLALGGADILVTIAEFPDPRAHHWKTLAVSRAIENQVPHIACNRTGNDPYSSYFGGSLVIDGWGEIKAEAGSDECILMYDIDMGKTEEIRSAIPVFDDRRSDLY